MNSGCNSIPRMPNNSFNAFLPKSSPQCVTGTLFTSFRDSVAGACPDFSPDTSHRGRSNLQIPARSPPNRKYEDKLAVSPGGAPVIHRRDEGGGSDFDHLQHKLGPAVAHRSNLNKRKIDLPMEAPKIKRCRGSAEQNQKHQAGNANEIEKQGFIHVRARRGQATDSHSLAERARREKINKRMTALRNLVPSCYQATGNAVVLDEIINYIKSLQNQVEILSMKLTVASQGSNLCVEMENESPLPVDECCNTAMATPFPEEATARSDYRIARSESLDATRASLMMGIASADELPFDIGLTDASQWDFELQRQFQDGNLLP